MEPWEMTPAQFRAAHRRQIRVEYAVRGREYEECYSPAHTYALWWDGVKLAARRGTVLRPVVLDRLAPMNRYHILHDYREAIPAGYIVPEVRHKVS